ncbi:hypothetical protein [Rugamonas sp.]|uniref:hypothetical protein n=1 Tax=Rugamonas sp. TaxID=1926287 RepID=UPI0025D5EC1B|nr:hypothetical protein [Rugamonas sp.]
MPAVVEVATVIAAQPCYYVLSVSGGSEGAPFVADKEPVLVWAIESADSIHVLHPMTQGGIKIDAPVLRPDGTVSVGEVAWWADVTVWLADKLEALADQRKRARDEAARKQRGVIEKAELADKPAPALPPARVAIHDALEAARKAAP